MTVNKEIIETGRFLFNITESLKPFAQSRGVELSLKATRALPRLFSDRNKTTQVLVNLISNGIKHTDPGGSVTIDVPGMQKRGEETLLMISVRDTGRGIAPEDQKKIFEKFTQTGGAGGTSIKGSGPGLTMTKALVDLHGGTIDVKSEPGAGSVFTVSLPMLPEDSTCLDKTDDTHG